MQGMQMVTMWGDDVTRWLARQGMPKDRGLANAMDSQCRNRQEEHAGNP